MCGHRASGHSELDESRRQYLSVKREGGGEGSPFTALSGFSSSSDWRRVGRNRECWVSIMWTTGSWMSFAHTELSGRYRSCRAAWSAFKNAWS